MNTRSLLKQARDLREQERAASGEIVDDLAEEERSAVLSEIEQIVAKNRIQAGPETFRLKAQRRGLGLPLFVNIAAVVVVGAGLWLTSVYFAGRTQDARSGADITVTAESRIIEEVRRRSEQALAERDAEILAVQEELAAIQAQQRALAEEIDSQVAEREDELRTQVARDVAIERTRLQDEGLSSAEVDRLLSQYESARIAELEAELEQYREQLIAAQETRTAELARQEAATESALESARRERVAILEEARQAEEELRADFEAQLGRQRDEAEEAQARLSALTDQQEQRSFIENQIAGFYERIRTEVARARYVEAALLVEQLRNYLDRPDVRELPFMRDRRASDLYILESMNRLIEPLAADRSAVEDLSGQMASLQDERETLRETEESLRAQLAEARAEVEEAQNEASEARAAADAAREDASVSDAEAEAAESRAAAAETQALEAEQRARAAEERVAAAEAEAAEARTAFTESQARLEALQAELARAQDESGSTDEDLSAAISRAEAAEDELSRVQSRLTQAENQVSDARQRAAAAEDRAENAERRADSAEARANELASALEAEGQVTEVDPETIEELDRLRSIEATVQRAGDAYERFAEAQADLSDDDTVVEVIDGKLRLDQFLRSQAVQAVFPGIADEVSRFDEAFEVSGRRAALGDMLEIVYSLSALQAPADRMQFLSEEQARTDDPVVFEFLAELMDLVAN